MATSDATQSGDGAPRRGNGEGGTDGQSPGDVVGLKEATTEAYERGVRGVPSVLVGDQVFWGDDRLEEAAAALQAA